MPSAHDALTTRPVAHGAQVVMREHWPRKHQRASLEHSTNVRHGRISTSWSAPQTSNYCHGQQESRLPIDIHTNRQNKDRSEIVDQVQIQTVTLTSATTSADECILLNRSQGGSEKT